MDHQVIESINPLAFHGLVSSESMIPEQQKTSLKDLTAKDIYIQKFLKYPFEAILHSKASFIHALLLESNPKVSSFVPRPYKLLIQNRVYIPDVYYVEDGVTVVAIIKSSDKKDSSKESLLKQFFDWHRIEFKVLSRESLLRQEDTAEHWGHVIRSLVSANTYAVNTDALEVELINTALNYENPCVRDLLTISKRDIEPDIDIALYRLIYQHKLVADLSVESLSFDTELTVCI